MSVPMTAVHGSVRFSFSRYNTEQDVDRIIEVFPQIVANLRRVSRTGTRTNAPRAGARTGAGEVGRIEDGDTLAEWSKRPEFCHSERSEELACVAIQARFFAAIRMTSPVGYPLEFYTVVGSGNKRKSVRTLWICAKSASRVQTARSFSMAIVAIRASANGTVTPAVRETTGSSLSEPKCCHG